MEQFELIIPTLFGLEAFAAREVRALGYETTQVEDGRVTFFGGWDAVCRANLWVRCGERVLIKIAEFEAHTFDALFEQAKAIAWDRWLPKDAAFPVKGHCLKSTLASVRDCQAILKKAIAASLSASYGINWFEEDGAVYQLQFSILKNRVTLMLDTSGAGLHKRGYRQASNAAPLRETLAAAMVALSHWKYEYPLADPFCGSGTIPIEAALYKRNIAPGLARSFAAEQFSQLSPTLWAKHRAEAEAAKKEVPLQIHAADIDPKTAALAAENARIAGVADAVRPCVGDARAFSAKEAYGTIICNPPYGERLGDQQACEQLYRAIGKSFTALDNWSYYMITSHEHFEALFGKKANKKRKLYNGMIRCNVYQYFGARPPKNN